MNKQEIIEAMATAAFELDEAPGIEECRMLMKAAFTAIEPLLREATGVLGDCDEAMDYMSEYDIPIGLPGDVKHTLARLQAALGEETQQCNHGDMP